MAMTSKRACLWPLVLASLALAPLVVAYYNPKPSNTQCNLQTLSVLRAEDADDPNDRAKFVLRRDGGSRGAPVVAQSGCCEQKTSFLFRNCQSFGLTVPEPTGSMQCAVIVVGGTPIAPADNSNIRDGNVIEVRNNGDEFIWFVEYIPATVSRFDYDYKIFRINSAGRRLYLDFSYGPGDRDNDCVERWDTLFCKRRARLSSGDTTWTGNFGNDFNKGICKWQTA